MPHEAVMIGDSAKDDVVCGNRAGSATILLDTEGEYKNMSVDRESQPHYVARSMHEIAEILQADFVLGKSDE